ncbi:MAG: tetratricopeptide repeat protein [Gammaproteobacteria bacterium]
MTMKNCISKINPLRPSRLTALRSGALLLLAIMLGACSPEVSEQELLDRARQALTQGEDRAAEIDVKTALQQNPGNAAGRRLLGEVYLFQQNPVVAAEELERSLSVTEDEEARILYARALLASGDAERLLAMHELGEFASVSEQPRYQVILARVYASNGELERARSLVDEAFAVAPEDPMVATSRALFQLAVPGEVADGRTLLESTLEAHPDYAEAWSLLGGIQRGEGALADAEASYASVVALNPYRFTDLLSLVEVRMDQGKVDQVRNDLQTLLRNYPDHPGVSFLQGRLLIQSGDNEGALAALFNVLNVIPDHSGSLFLSAVANIGEGNLATARGQLDRLLAAEPGNLQGQLMSANLYLQQGDPESAEEVARSILQFDAMNYPAMGILVSALEAQDQGGAQSIELLERMINVNPEAPEPRMALGSALMQSGDTAGGIAQLQAARDLTPQLTQVREALIQAHLSAGDIESAMAEAEDYAQQLPDNPRPNLFMARIAMQQNDMESARGHFSDAEARLRQALEEQPDNLGLQALLVDVLVRLGNLEEAGTLLAQFPEEYAENPSVLVARGRIALAMDRHAEAEPLLRRAQEENPNTYTILWLSGAVGAQGRGDEAISLLEDWLDEYPADQMVRNELATTYLALGNEQQSQKRYQELLDDNPDNVVALNNLAWLMREVDPQQALTHIERADSLVPDNPQILDTYAMVQLELGALEEALTLNQRALDSTPADPSIRTNRAAILHANGQTGEAVAILEAIISDDSVADSQREAARSLLAELQ